MSIFIVLRVLYKQSVAYRLLIKFMFRANFDCKFSELCTSVRLLICLGIL